MERCVGLLVRLPVSGGSPSSSSNMFGGSDFLVYQQERSDGSLAVAAERFKAGSRDPVLDVQHICAVSDEQGSCHSLPLLDTTDQIHTLAASKANRSFKHFILRGPCRIWADDPWKSRTVLSEMILGSTALRWILSSGGP